MGSIPLQRETAYATDEPSRPPGAPAAVRTSLPGNPLAPAAARRFVRGALADWAEFGLTATAAGGDRLTDDAVVVLSELVTNAVVHAGTNVELLCRLETGHPDDLDGGCAPAAALVIEVSDHHPARAVRSDRTDMGPDTPECGRGLRLVASLSDAWGITYQPGTKTVWARLPVDGAEPRGGAPEAFPGARTFQRGLRAADILAPTPHRYPHDQDWVNRGALSFLAEASDLLAGQLDEDQVASLAGQMLVPRLADWCAVWLDDEDGRPDRGAADRAGRGTGVLATPRLARVWHTSENRMEELRKILEKDPPQPTDAARSAAVPVPWPFESLGGDPAGAALAYRLSAGGRAVGTLLIGRAGLTRFPDEVTGLVEDFARRVALAVSAARRYARQATISRILQRGLLPSAVAQIPGIESALVYEPRDAGGPGGDFYDVFPAGDGRWCFALGDVQERARRRPSSSASPGPGCGCSPARSTRSPRSSTASTGSSSTTPRRRPTPRPARSPPRAVRASHPRARPASSPCSTGSWCPPSTGCAAPWPPPDTPCRSCCGPTAWSGPPPNPRCSSASSTTPATPARVSCSTTATPSCASRTG